MCAKTVKNVPVANPNTPTPKNTIKNPLTPHFAFTKDNYRLMLVGIGVILLGYVIMSLDKEPHGFGFLGLTLGPIVVMAGFLFEFFAIFYTKKNN
jgi:uncharacterized RDD family membrane protein YckC